MNINAAIIDQRLQSVAEEIRVRSAEELNIKQEERLKSLAFVYLCVKTVLDLNDEETFDCLTEGGGDFGVDAVHCSEEIDGEFTVTLFQGKYKMKDLEGQSNFPEGGIDDLNKAIRYIFDPSIRLERVNERLKAKMEEIRSLIRDGYIPQVRAIACNNGLIWNAAGQDAIDRANFGGQVAWEHVNHDRLVMILQAPKSVSDSVQLTGKAIVEDYNFVRVLVARISVTEIASLFERHGERLLERNIRRYLGTAGNRVNEAISETLQTEERANFYFYNNGITMICDKFSYNALQSGDFKVKVDNLQIINGGQTCMTICKTLNQPTLFFSEEEAYVLIRLYQLPSDNHDLVQQITFATNSQNPVDMRDLRANDDKQQRLQIDIEQLGYSYHRKRSDVVVKPTDITSGVAAEAILSVWRRRPQQAKFLSREHFGKLYRFIFADDLNGAQTIIATLLYRQAENRRRRPWPEDPPLVRYASCFIAMQMGKYLLKDLQCEVGNLTHRNFLTARALVEENAEHYFDEAIFDIVDALGSLYGGTEVSMQQLAATFRRGDLIELLELMVI
ncbi:MAG: AIPR family protein [Syntrophomonas sp.]|nr:AIPR family protein [Syntrophomonas sp.]